MQGERPTSALAGPVRWVAVGAIGASALAGTAWTLATRTPRDVPELPLQTIVLPPPAQSTPSFAPSPAQPAALGTSAASESSSGLSGAPVEPAPNPSATSDHAALPLPMIVSRSRIGPPVPDAASQTPTVAASTAQEPNPPATIAWKSPAGAIAPIDPASKPAATPAPAAANPTRKININKAPAAELELLPDVGPALAKRILDHRTKHGPFKTLEDLDKVPGIGPKTLEKFKDRILFADPPTPR
jgi:competence protein ComEA